MSTSPRYSRLLLHPLNQNASEWALFSIQSALIAGNGG
jgi:hypothetical protein